jgi:hypothetical protein
MAAVPIDNHSKEETSLEATGKVKNARTREGKRKDES